MSRAKTSGRSGRGRSSRWILFICAALSGLTFAAYSHVIWHEFVNFDDGAYVFENPHVTSGLSWGVVRWAFTSMSGGNWHPLTWLSHAMDCQLFGLNAGLHHSTSLLLHIINVILLFVLLEQATHARWRSFTVAAIFAIHPLNVESVAWIAERKNVLCALFFLLSLGAYGWYARKPSVSRYLSVAVLFALSLAAKAMAITLPLALLLLDYWPLQRIEGWTDEASVLQLPRVRFWPLVIEKLPLLALSIASGVVTFVAQRRAGAVAQVAGWPFSWRVGNAIHSYGMYLYLIFFPHGLAPFYPATPLQILQVLWTLILICAVSGLVWKFRTGRPYLLVCWLWFLGMMLPVIGFIQVGSQSMADRYIYIPEMGLLVAVVWSADDLLRTSHARPLWGYAMAGLTIVVLSMSTWRQVRYWDNSYDLWTHALQVTRSNYVAEENLAVHLLSLGREQDAFPHFEGVLAVKPDDVIAWLNVGNYLEHDGRHEEAIQAFQQVASLTHEPDKLTGAYRGLGVAYAQLGDRAQARTNFLRALQLNPNGETELFNLSLLEMRDGIDKLSQSVAAHPTAQGYWQLGQLLQDDQRTEDARLAYEKALHLNPKMQEAQQSLRSLKQTQD